MLLSIFPLKMVVFPNEKVNLHIFESRYKQLINDCNTDKTSFGIPFYHKGRLMPTVTEVSLKEISKVYEDGKLDVKTQATTTVYRIKEIHQNLPGKLYTTAVVEPLEYTYNDKDAFLSLQIQEQMIELYQLLKIDKKIPSVEDLWLFDFGHHLGLSPIQEFHLLTIQSERERQNFVHKHLTDFIPKITEMQELQRKAKLNGHFKNILPPDFKISDL